MSGEDSKTIPRTIVLELRLFGSLIENDPVGITLVVGAGPFLTSGCSLERVDTPTVYHYRHLEL